MTQFKDYLKTKNTYESLLWQLVTAVVSVVLAGFAADNIVFGLGSYTYQFVTRDTYGMAVKATYGAVKGAPRELMKDPITDNGTKKSAQGLLRVELEGTSYVLHEQQTWEQEKKGELELLFENSELMMFQSLSDIRKRLGAIK